MKKSLYLFVVIILISCLLCSTSLALTPLGPPRAGLKQKQQSLGFLFAISEMDLGLSGPGGSATVPDIETTPYLFKGGYGVSDGLEIYTLVGFSDISSEGVHGSSELAWGFGGKFTFSESDPVTWGGLFQMVSISSERTWSDFDPYWGVETTKVDVQLYDIQIAFGPTYTRDAFSIYGGPFLHFVEGDADVSVDGAFGSADIEQESEFGAYVGAQFVLAESGSLFFEYQKTGDASAFAGGFVWRF